MPLESDQDIARYDGWLTEAGGQRIQLGIAIDTKKQIGDLYVGDHYWELRKLKKLRTGNGLVGVARVEGVDRPWSIVSRPAGAAFTAEITLDGQKDGFTDSDSLLHYWIPELRLPAAAVSRKRSPHAE